MLTEFEKDEFDNVLPPENVGMKNCEDKETKFFEINKIGPNDAPTGTVTIIEVAETELICAFTAPKKTMLFDNVVLKFEPLIVTIDPIGPIVGVKEVIVGGGFLEPFAGKLKVVHTLFAFLTIEPGQWQT